MLISNALAVLSFVAAVTLAATWHELGHLLAARILRVPVKLVAVGLGPALWRHTLRGDVRFELRAVPLGMAVGVVGRRTLDGRVRRPVNYDIAIAIAGPAASMLLAFLLVVLAVLIHAGPALHLWLVATGLLSALLGLLNLIPVPGLDGGHLLMLLLALRGWQLSPQGEVMVHRIGMRAMILATVLASVYQVLHSL
jgi:membrane-associated protease RseP (regulator of RpoE activity)